MRFFSWLGGRPISHTRHTSRRSTRAGNKRAPTRKLAVETLESRTLMSASPASPGSMDPSFDPSGTTPGIVTTAFPIPWSQLGVKSGLVSSNPQVAALAVLPTAQSYGKNSPPAGSVIAVGSQTYADASGPYAGVVEDASFLVAMYNPDGSLNKNFGSGGEVVTTFFTISDSLHGSYATSVVLDPVTVNGQIQTKILVTGYVDGRISTGKKTSTLAYDVAVERLNLDGTLDTTFNGTGKELISSPSASSSSGSDWLGSNYWWPGPATAALAVHGEYRYRSRLVADRAKIRGCPHPAHAGRCIGPVVRHRRLRACAAQVLRHPRRIPAATHGGSA